MAIRLPHTADVHLGRAFGYLGEHARPQHQQRLLHTFERLILTARQHNCHALLVAGDLFEQLRETCRQLNATIAFEAVSGMTAARVLRALPDGGRLVLYGALSESPLMADPRDLIFQRKRVEGFWLADWLARRSLWGQLRLARQVQNALGDLLRTEVAGRYPLHEVHRALQDYQASMTAGKRLLVMHKQ
jgi:NADPH:quinone reductase-like Zn-dependent oxidoreductase